jgi:hypothetical protein
MEEKKDTVVGTVMKQGGGAGLGAFAGWTIGSVIAVAAAPFTGGLSILIPVGVAAAGGVIGHKAAKDLD